MTVHPRLSVSPSLPKATSNLSRMVVSKVTPCSEQKPSAKEKKIDKYVFSLYISGHGVRLILCILMTRMTIKPFESFKPFSTRLILPTVNFKLNTIIVHCSSIPSC